MSVGDPNLQANSGLAGAPPSKQQICLICTPSRIQHKLRCSDRHSNPHGPGHDRGQVGAQALMAPEGVKPCRSECRYSDVVSRFVFSAVLSVKGLRDKPRPLSRSVLGMPRMFHFPPSKVVSIALHKLSNVFYAHVSAAGRRRGAASVTRVANAACWVSRSPLCYAVEARRKQSLAGVDTDGFAFAAATLALSEACEHSTLAV